MKSLKGFIIVMGVLYIGFLCKHLIPIPVPETVYGMILLLILLKTGLVALETIEPISTVLLAYLASFFLPPGVGLMETYKKLEGILIPVLLICVVSTALTMIASGLTVKWLKERKNVQ